MTDIKMRANLIFWMVCDGDHFWSFHLLGTIRAVVVRPKYLTRKLLYWCWDTVTTLVSWYDGWRPMLPLHPIAKRRDRMIDNNTGAHFPRNQNTSKWAIWTTRLCYQVIWSQLCLCFFLVTLTSAFSSMGNLIGPNRLQELEQISAGASFPFRERLLSSKGDELL